MKAWLKKWTNHPFVENLLRFYKGSDIDLSSIAVAYYLLVAVFPIFFLLASLLPYLRINVADVLEFLETTLPAEVYAYARGPVRSILSNPSSGWLGLSIITTLWTFSQSMLVLQKAFNKAYGMEDHRDMIIGRLVGIFIGLILQACLFLLILVGLFGETITIFINRYAEFDLNFFREMLSRTQPLIYLGFILVILVLYHFLPNVQIKKLRYIWPGSFFVIALLTATTNLISLYLNRYISKFESFHLVSYVLLLMVLVWFILLAKVLIIGAVINASFQALYETSFMPRSGTLSGVVDKIKKLKYQKAPILGRTQGLLVINVDGILIQEKTIDILGDLAGRTAQMAEITERIIQGELDFEKALKEQVALLEGLPVSVFDLILTRFRLTKGIKALVNELHARGYKVGLVSDSFHEHIDPLAKDLGIDYVKANRLETKDGKLTGRTQGQIVTKTTKVAMLKAWASENHLDISQTIAVGQGFNDLAMMETAGLGVTFRGQALVRNLVPYNIDEEDLFQVIEILDGHLAISKESD